MKRILVDTNVVLDVLLNREPHVGASAAVWQAIETGGVEGLLSAHAIPTIHYLIRKERGGSVARRTLGEILRVFLVAAVDGSVIQHALESPCPDFEDSVSAAAARLAGCDVIVTRDPKGFPSSPVRVLSPEAVAPLLRKI